MATDYTKYDDFGKGLQRSPFLSALSGLGRAQGTTDSSKQSGILDEEAFHFFDHLEEEGLIKKDGAGKWRVDVKILKGGYEAELEKFGKYVKGISKFRARRELKDLKQQYKEGTFKGVQDMGDGTYVIQNGEGQVDETATEGGENLIKFPESALQTMLDSGLDNLYRKAKPGKQNYLKASGVITDIVGLESDLFNLQTQDYEPSQKTLELESMLKINEDKISAIYDDIEDLDPQDNRDIAFTKLDEKIKLEEALRASVQDDLTANQAGTGPTQQQPRTNITDPDQAVLAGEAQAVAEDFTGDPDQVAPADIATTKRTRPQNMEVFENNTVSSRFDSLKHLSNTELEAEAGRHQQVVDTALTYPTLQGGGGNMARRRAIYASETISKSKANIAREMSKDQPKQSTIDREKGKIAQAQLDIEKYNKAFEGKVVVDYTRATKGKGKGKQTLSKIVDDPDYIPKNQAEIDAASNMPPIPDGLGDDVFNDLKAKRDELIGLRDAKNTLKEQLLATKAKDAKTVEDLITSKNLELVEKRALFLDLSYNYALLAAGQGDEKHDLPSAMFSMYTQLTNYAITGKPMTPKAIQDSHTRFEATRTFNQQKTVWWDNYRLNDIEPNVRKIAEGIRNLRVNPDGSEMSWTKGLQFNYQAGLGQLFDIHESMLNELNNTQDLNPNPINPNDQSWRERRANYISSMRRTEDTIGELMGEALLSGLQFKTQQAGIFKPKTWDRLMFKLRSSISDDPNLGGIIGQINGHFDTKSGKLLSVTFGGIGPVPVFENGKVKTEMKDGKEVVVYRYPSEDEDAKAFRTGKGKEYLKAPFIGDIFGDGFQWFSEFLKFKAFLTDPELGGVWPGPEPQNFLFEKELFKPQVKPQGVD